MPFTAPDFVARLPYAPPDNVPVHEFMFGDNERFGRRPLTESKAPFTCGISGKSYSAPEVRGRIDCLARAIGKELDWNVNEGTEFEKVVGIYSVNTIDTATVTWAAHRLNGIASLASATYTAHELIHQLQTVEAKVLFTCVPLLPIALEAAAAVNIPRHRIFLLDVPDKITKGATAPVDFRTVDQLIEQGRSLPELPKLSFSEGQGARQTAYLCSSSGTSGLPKSVKISHQNVIAAILQAANHESTYIGPEPEFCLGVLPFSHNFALMIVAHLSIYRGDGVVVLPNFDLFDLLRVIQDYRLGRLWMVPAMVGAMLKATEIVKQYDLSSVNTTVVGAAILSADVRARYTQLVPGSRLVQGYGLTETTVAVTFENPHDIVVGSCGNLFPGVEARLVDPASGSDIEEHGKQGELWVRSETIMQGFYKNDAETASMLGKDGWLRTGDLVEFRKSPNGHDHIFLIDRIKELIKVRGMQVSPTEIEDHLLLHPLVADIVVVPIPDDAAGDLPLAFAVKSPLAAGKTDEAIAEALVDYVAGEFAAHKRLAGGVEFVDSLPKSASGKTKRGVMRARAKEVLNERRAKAAAKMMEVFDFDSDEEEDEIDNIAAQARRASVVQVVA
ncbi:acetyl-CoA synthetase-like protein [Myriangium duriaei CBS 260.36]|uniref:Acetyl-CoA synthetase-like protein n=1 Tax=Myriangium duriaei CBS 260.36 TaxID=1168546 RepID=A0A9P4J8F0_9PEZI|nr:acetyl-CoA synthetase-like protein [Myriangium duriaei CBS 260.36]